MKRIWIWSTNQTPNCGSGKRLVFVESFRRGRGQRGRTYFRLRGRLDQKRPDVLTRDELEVIRVDE